MIFPGLNLPIVLRELRVTAAEHQVLRTRDQVARWVGVGMFVLLILEFVGIPAVGFLAVPVYLAVALACAVLPARLCLGLVLEERRSGTLGDMFLAGVTPGGFLLGKVVAAAGMCGSLLLGLLPLVALPFLTGGLSAGTFTGMLGLLPALVLASLGVGLLISSLVDSEERAFTSAFMVGAVWATALPLVYWMGRILTGTPAFSEAWLGLSPLFPLLLIRDGLSAVNIGAFWRSVVSVAAVGCVCLLVSALVLPRRWRRDVAACRAVRPGARGFASNPTPVDDPLSGLLRIERARLRWYRATVVGFAVLWIAGALFWGRAWLSTTLALAFLVFLQIVTYATETLLLTAGVSRLRRNGAFEEILVTPLDDAEIVDGILGGYERLVRPVRRLATGLALLVFLVAGATRQWTAGALVSYLLLGGTLLALIHFRRAGREFAGFRLALLTGSTAISFGHGGGVGLSALLWQAFYIHQMFNALRGMGRLPLFPTGSPLELSLVILGSFVMLLLAAVQYDRADGRDLAVAELRRLTAEPLADRRDKRLKHWHPYKSTPAL